MTQEETQPRLFEESVLYEVVLESGRRFEPVPYLLQLRANAGQTDVDLGSRHVSWQQFYEENPNHVASDLLSIIEKGTDAHTKNVFLRAAINVARMLPVSYDDMGGDSWDSKNDKLCRCAYEALKQGNTELAEELFTEVSPILSGEATHYLQKAILEQKG